MHNSRSVSFSVACLLMFGATFCLEQHGFLLAFGSRVPSRYLSFIIFPTFTMSCLQSEKSSVIRGSNSKDDLSCSISVGVTLMVLIFAVNRSISLISPNKTESEEDTESEESTDI